MPQALYNFKLQTGKQLLAKPLKSGDTILCATLSSNLQTLIIANDSFHATRLQNELKTFAPQLSSTIFTDYGILPYERNLVSKEVIANRLLTLWQISQNQHDIIIIPASVINNKLPPLEYLNSRFFSLKINEKLSIEELRHQLINGGYNLVDQVFENGDFAVRGGIIDIIPMGIKHIIRIELFDDEIETIKLLDIKTRDLISIPNSFELVPTREYPTDSISLKNFAHKFNEYFPNTSLKLQQDFKYGILPPGTEFYLPLFFDNCVSIFEYFKKDYQVVYFGNTRQILENHWLEIKNRYLHSNYQYPCLKPSDIYYQTEEIFQFIKKPKSFIINNNGDLDKQFNPLPDLAIKHIRCTNPISNLQAFITSFKGPIVIILQSAGRIEIMRELLTKNDLSPTVINNIGEINPKKSIHLLVGALYDGFILNNTAFISEKELYNLDYTHIKRNLIADTLIENDSIVRDLAEIEIGDYVVHINHGIGKYLGLITQTIDNVEHEMIELEYQNDSKLFIPIHNLHLISRYSKLDGSTVELNTLGSSKWDKIRKKCEKKIEDVAARLLELYANREMQKGQKFTIPESYPEFCDNFGYEPTPDQSSCFEAIISDMQSSKPMDRLICGDVGFGKTEVAIRAAFIAAMNGKQVAVLSPTTLLTEQHFENFSNRFTGFPLKVAEISRFRSKKEIAEVLTQVESGLIDVLIGTHRIIQSDIKFKNLGLVIIDEEHKFGVKQKERLKELRANVDFLTLTATPIPRTLSMALDGIRDFSIIATPPKKRLSTNTQIIMDDNQIIKDAITRETRRGGQVYFLYNNVQNINEMLTRLNSLVPELEIAVAHGQMNEHVLEQTIRDFILQRYHILLCSTIIESGIDIPNANTIIIYGAHELGLAQLHQLRGRVGRSSQQGYCYLVTPEKMSRDASKRLDAIKATSELGAGFNLAMHDLEIRGAGEILGDTQSGDIKEVGLSLYTDILKKTIKRLKSNAVENPNLLSNELNCEINFNATAIIPDKYCQDIHERLIYYKKLSRATNNEEIDNIYQNLIDNFGLPGIEVKALIASHRLRIIGLQFGLNRIDTYIDKIVLTFKDKPNIEINTIIQVMQELKTCKYDGKNKLIWAINSEDTEMKLFHTNLIIDLLRQ